MNECGLQVHRFYHGVERSTYTAGFPCGHPIDVKQPRESFVDDLDREIYELCMSQFVPPVMSC